MSLDLFRLIGGIDLQNQALNNHTNILHGSGLPGIAQTTIDAPVGSIYMRTDAEADGLQLYWKWSLVDGGTADWKTATDKDYVDAVAQGLSWREPVRVMDKTSTSLPPGPIPTVDGVTIDAGDRVLFTSLTGGSPVYTDRNIWIWDGATWTEDPYNQESDGDAVLVQEGTYGEQQWVYDGTKWVQFGSVAGYEELTYIRNFIGKNNAGVETPTYTSTNVVTANTNLENAIGELDAEFGDGVITNDNIDGSPAAYALSDDMNWAGGTLDLTNALNELNDAIGNRTYTHSDPVLSVVTDGDTVAQSIDDLNEAIIDLKSGSDSITGSIAATASAAIDSVPLTVANQAKWLVQVSDGANRRALEIHAFTNGVTTDYTKFSILKIGTGIATFDIYAEVSGGNFRLVATGGTSAITYTVKRLGFSKLA